MADQRAPLDHTPSSDPRTAGQEEKVVTPTEASQAVKTGHMRYVLGIGILLVIVAFGIVYLSNT